MPPDHQIRGSGGILAPFMKNQESIALFCGYSPGSEKIRKGFFLPAAGQDHHQGPSFPN